MSRGQLMTGANLCRVVVWSLNFKIVNHMCDISNQILPASHTRCIVVYLRLFILLYTYN